MENIQKGVKDYKNIVSIDSNFSLNDSNIDDDNVCHFKVTQKNGEIEMVLNEPYIDYNDLNNHDINDDSNDDDNLSEFSQYKEFENDYEDELECELDFDFDIIFTPENNSELLKLTEIKSKIVNRIKLNALDLSHIKKIEDDEKFLLIKLFNHMV